MAGLGAMERLGWSDLSKSANNHGDTITPYNLGIKRDTSADNQIIGTFIYGLSG